jgi:MoaA/NifB/PqqE/SkfB family radical SAM enzyme
MLKNYYKNMKKSRIITYLQPHFKCNLKCNFCYIWQIYLNSEKSVHEKELDQNKLFSIYFIEKKYIEKDTKFIFRILWWESLLSESYYKSFFNYIIDNNLIDLIDLIEINTNWTTLIKFLSFLKLNNFENIFKSKLVFKVSIHWVWEIHNKIVWWKVFSLVIKNILTLCKEWYRIDSNYVLNKSNILYLEKYAKMFFRISPKWNLVVLFVSFDWDWFKNIKKNFIDFSNIKIFNYINKIVKETKDKYKYFEINTNLPYCIDNINPNEEWEKRIFYIYPGFISKLLINISEKDKYINLYKKSFLNYDEVWIGTEEYKWKIFILDKCIKCNFLKKCPLYLESEAKILSSTHWFNIKGISYIDYFVNLKNNE